MLFSAMLAASTAGVHAAELQPLVSVDWLKAHQSQPDLVVRTVYIFVALRGMTAIVGSHLASPSSGRAVSPEDFAGACAPCPSKK